MNRKLSRLVASGVCLAMAGCVLKTPQLDALLSINKTSDTANIRKTVDSRWTVKIGTVGHIVEVYEENNLFIFVSDSDDVLVFDGWRIRSFQGFDQAGLHQIVVDGENVQYKAADVSSIVLCEPWRVEIDPANNALWSQKCDGDLRPSTISVGHEGDITEINQNVTAKGLRAVLRPVFNQ